MSPMIRSAGCDRPLRRGTADKPIVATTPGSAGFIENFKHPFACRAAGLHQLIQLVQPADRIVKKCREHQERDEIANLHAPVKTA